MSLYSDEDFPYQTQEVDSGGPLGLSPAGRTIVVFLLTFAAGLALVMLVIVPALQPRSAPLELIAIPDYSQPTAREAYIPAVEVIRAQYPQATLAAAAGAWTPQIDRVQLEAGRTSWTYFFFLPDRQQMATVIVDADGLARIDAIDSWPEQPSLLDDQRWNTDSPEVTIPLLERCDDLLRSQPDSWVELRLSTAAANRTLLWQATISSPQAPEEACAITVDASTGILR